MIRSSLAAFAAALVLSAPVAYAQTVASFTTSNVIESLAALGVQGARAESRDNGDGTKTDAVSFEAGGLKRVAVLAACGGPQGCLGLYLLTIWSADASINLNAVNALNADWAFGKAFITSNGAFVYARYVIADGGITKAHLQASIGVYVNATPLFVELMSRKSNTVSLDEKDALRASDAPRAGDDALTGLVRPEDVNSLRQTKSPRAGDVGFHAVR